MPSDPKHHVFLSFSHKDAEIMQRVRDDLRTEGLTVWTDGGIEPGTPLWDKAIEDVLTSAGCMVVILSPDANHTDSIHSQIGFAQKISLRIFPVIARGDEWSAIPKVLIGTQMIDVRANHEARMKRLVELIDAHLRTQKETRLSAEYGVSIEDEIYSFLLSRPTLEQITDFHLSDMLEKRMSYLLDRNRDHTLTDAERVEFDKYFQIEDFMRGLKIRPYGRLNKQKTDDSKP